MIQLDLFLLLILWIYLALQLLAFARLLAYQAPKKHKNNYGTELPFISILVAARNEAHQIKNCILSLHALNYPPEKFEILIGDDASDDETVLIVEELMKQIPNLRLINIKQQLGLARAKANVLANLVHQAKSEYLFVTDADISVKPNWILVLLPHIMNSEIGIVSNATMVKGKSWFDKMQQIEWMLGFGSILAFEQMGLKSTAVGNNMAFTKKAYFDAGTYENIPFSVTEDFQLFRYIRKAGYKGLTIMQAEGLNISAPQKKFMNLLQQRKRWMMGAADLPLVWKLIFLLQAAFFPLFILLAFLHLKIALILIGLKLIFQSLIIWRLAYLLNEKRILLFLPVFAVYQELMVLCMSIFYMLPIQMEWKKRNY